MTSSPALDLKPGSHITLTAKNVDAAATILDVSDASDAQGLERMPITPSQRLIVASSPHYRRIAAIGYDWIGPQNERVPVMLAAVEDREGRWWTLYGGNVHIEPRTIEPMPTGRDQPK